MKAFGGLVLLSKEEFVIDTTVFGDGPWVHMASVRRARPGKVHKDYVCFRHQNSSKVYIEEIDEAAQDLRKIESDAEWADVYRFLTENGVFTLGVGKEKILAE